MNKWILAVVLMAVVLASGCSGVIMNAQYSSLLDQTVALSVNTALRADANSLTVPEMKACLKAQAGVWQRFADARDGKDAAGK